ncbi:MAG: phosphotransferase [Actinomycetota bacterium]
MIAPDSTRLREWGRVEVIGSLGGGHRNDVVEVLVDGVRAVARTSRRPTVSLSWELDLLRHLADEGFRVPRTVPALDGRRYVDGIVVQTFVEGRAPSSEADWGRVVAELVRLHEATVDWPQRPGARAVADLEPGDRSGDVDLAAMPVSVVEECRRAWAPLAGLPRSAVHGDPGAGNLRIAGDGVGLIDWDEARVDAGVLDLADVPTRPLDEPLASIAARAAHAWEAANGWTIEPAYARRRLAALRAASAPG